MCFRIQRWSLKKDWSVQIEAQTVTASMYDLDVGPKPMDVVPAPMPALFYPIPLGPVWAPYQVQASSSDALFPSEWTFDSDQEYTTLADGSALASLIVTGKLPVNEFSATGAGAPGIGSISQSTTGGSLPADITLWAAHLRDRFERRFLPFHRTSPSSEPGRRRAARSRSTTSRGQQSRASLLTCCSSERSPT